MLLVMLHTTIFSVVIQTTASRDVILRRSPDVDQEIYSLEI